MSRGRKKKIGNSNSTWEQIFNKNIGNYFQTIIIELAQEANITDENAASLLKQICALNKKRYQDVKQNEIPFMIPSNWLWCNMGQLIEFTENLNIESKLPPDTLINYVDIDAVDNRKFEIKESKLKTVAELSSRARRVLRKGYLMYSLVRPYLNNIAIIEENKPNYIGSTGFAVFTGVLVSNRYLKYVLLSEYVRKMYLDLLSGFNSPSISQEQFISTLVPLPPLAEQNKIVDFLTDFETDNLKSAGSYFNANVEQKIIDLHNSQLVNSDLSNELTAQLTLVQKLRQQLQQDAVQGRLVSQDSSDEPGSELLKKIKAEKAKDKKYKELPAIKPDEVPFDIPDNWVWCRLREIAVDVSYGTSQKADVIGEVPVLRMGNITANGEILYSNLKFVSTSIPDLPKLYLDNGDLVFNRTNSYELVGKAGVFENDKNYTLASYLIRVRFHSAIQTKFISNYINSKICRTTQIEPQIIQQNGQANFNGTKLSSILIPLPPASEQQRIVNKLEELIQICKELDLCVENNKRQNEQLLQQVLREALCLS